MSKKCKKKGCNKILSKPGYKYCYVHHLERLEKKHKGRKFGDGTKKKHYTGRGYKGNLAPGKHGQKHAPKRARHFKLVSYRSAAEKESAK